MWNTIRTRKHNSTQVFWSFASMLCQLSILWDFFLKRSFPLSLSSIMMIKNCFNHSLFMFKNTGDGPSLVSTRNYHMQGQNTIPKNQWTLIDGHRLIFQPDFSRIGSAVRFSPEKFIPLFTLIIHNDKKAHVMAHHWYYSQSQNTISRHKSIDILSRFFQNWLTCRILHSVWKRNYIPTLCNKF